MQTMNGKPMRERGQSLVLIALMVMGLVAFVGLALDGGQFYEMRRQAQNAADAAALAAVDEVAMGQNALVYYRISQYAIGNSTVGNGATGFGAVYQPSNVAVAPGVPPPLGTDCVKVTANKTFPTLIISFLGFSTLTVNASASGCFGQVIHPTAPLWPMTIYTQSFTKGQIVTLFGGGQKAPGQFGWISYDGSMAASDLWPKLQNLYPGPYRVYDSGCSGSGQTNVASIGLPTCIQGAPGVKASDQTAAATQLNKTVVVPIYDDLKGQGSNTYYHIIGFAAFYVTAVCLQNPGVGDCSGTNGKDIKGKFVDYVITGQWCKPLIQDCGPDWGLKTIKLSQ